MHEGKQPPPGMTRKQWRRLRNEMETARPGLRTASGILAEHGGRAVDRRTLSHVLPPKKRK